uniref:Glutamyl-tRNA(Gln) amidotransferase subunit B, chloroplastic/mitochondrial n=1 Tax=Lygus hesperus TaxID=30085 RepID=A0A0A9ZFF0_LYGHE
MTPQALKQQICNTSHEAVERSKEERKRYYQFVVMTQYLCDEVTRGSRHTLSIYTTTTTSTTTTIHNNDTNNVGNNSNTNKCNICLSSLPLLKARPCELG